MARTEQQPKTASSREADYAAYKTYFENFTGTDTLIEKVKIDALERLPEGAHKNAQNKVINGIENRFRPYIEEGEHIAEQITSPEYKVFTSEIEDFLDVKPGGITCSDGRILSLSIFDPGVGRLHKRPQGMPEVRFSTHSPDKKIPVLGDTTISASIWNTVEERLDEGKNPEIVEFIIPHIYSTHPDHGCGAAKGEATKAGRPAATAMKFGGIELFHDKLGEGFYGFETDIKRAGGKGATFDATHDIHSQGLIFGLRDAYLNNWLDSEKTLRQNLEDLHADKKIVVSELIDEGLKPDMHAAMNKLGLDNNTKLDIHDPHQFANNAMIIGRVTKEITKKYEQEEDGFSWIPEHLREGKSEKAVRTLAYTAIRNSVYRQLSVIEPGNHDLLKHPEQLIRIGPIGATFNVETVPFIQVTPEGSLRLQDIEGVKKLYGLSEGILPELGVDLEQEARVIVTTGEYNEASYSNQKIARRAKHNVASTVKGNAAALREEFPEGVATGDTVVISALHESGSRKITDVLTAPIDIPLFKSQN